MRLQIVLGALVAVAAAGEALAHGPQIQATVENGKIVTRRLIKDGPYSDSLTAPTSVYVMPVVKDFSGVWLTRPNDALLPGGIPEFPSGPGLAYGYGYDASTNPAPFPLGSQLVLSFVDGLKEWDSAANAYIDPGVTELESFRGSGVNSVAARTSDTAPFADIKFPSVIPPATGIAFTDDETHTSVSYRMLGDGNSPTSNLPDGGRIYLASLRLGSTDPSVAASDPFYLVLSKGAQQMDVAIAAGSLGVPPSGIQFVPEPTAIALTALAAALTPWSRRRGR